MTVTIDNDDDSSGNPLAQCHQPTVPQDIVDEYKQSAIVPLRVSCPACGYEQTLEYKLWDIESASPQLQMLEALMKDDDIDTYRFVAAHQNCKNCGKELFSTLQVNARDV